MKKIVKIVASLSLGLLSVACQQFYVDTQMTPEKAAASLKLECDALDAYTIQGDKPQSVSFKVASTTPWKITGYESAQWLKVSPVSSDVSSLSEDIVITAAANPNYEDRSVTLTLQDQDQKLEAHKVVITQTRKGKLRVQPVSEVFEVEGNKLPFTIETNLAWEVRSADQWLSFDKTEGQGDGSVITVNAIAAKNNSVTRKTTVTVFAGEDKFNFEVNQKGQSLEFGKIENTEIARAGGSIELEVKATMDWVVSCDNSDFTLEKGDGKLIVSAPFNNKFAPKAGTITIKPASDDFGDVSSSVEVSQGCNFEISGAHEILDDGGIKITAGDKTRITTIDKIRYASFVLTMGDVHFGDKGTLCLSTHDAGNDTAEYQCQINLDGNKRLRTNGSGTSYGSVKFNITKDELNAMTTYRMDFAPDADVPGNIRLEYFYNGTSKATLSNPSVYTDDPETGGHYFIGYESAKDDDTWYVIKSCDVTFLGE